MATHWYNDPDTVRALYDLAIVSGALVKPSTEVADSCAALTVNMLAMPTYYPVELFTLGHDVQPGLNTLIDVVSRQHDFLAEALENVLKTDIFTRKLFDIYTEIHNDNKQTCVIGIHRCDYMLDWNETDDNLALKQIEMNTISCSNMGLSSKLKSFYEYVTSRYAEKKNIKVPDNPCLTGVVDALAMAWQEYDDRESVVLFVITPDERNLFDQRRIEFDLWQRYSIKSIRKSLSDISKDGSLGPNRQLIVSEVECAVVYFRAGYTPLHYPTEKEWQARLLVEKSTASLSPSVAYQLVGTKKIQQSLAAAGILERFISDSKMRKMIQSTFAGLYNLDKNSEGDRAIEMALRDPEKFVLKPQREGGGNNFFGEGLRQKLEEIRGTFEREAFILMDRLHPPPQEGLILRKKPQTLELKPELVTSELGIIGTYVKRGDRVLLNRSAGHVLRTKLMSVNEGGMSYGASLDSPSLLTTAEYVTKIIKQQQ